MIKFLIKCQISTNKECFILKKKKNTLKPSIYKLWIKYTKI